MPKNNKTRRRSVILSPVDRKKFTDEYLAAPWGRKMDVSEKYNVSESQALNIIEEHELGKNKRDWTAYNSHQQSRIIQEYISAPENEKRAVANRHGLMLRTVSSAVSRWREAGKLPDANFAPLPQAPEPKDVYRQARSKNNPISSFGTEVPVYQRPQRQTQTEETEATNARPLIPNGNDPRDEIWDLYKKGQISRELFDMMLDKLKG